MGYGLDALQADCYPDTTVLVNKANIRNPEKLAEYESLIVGVKSLEFELSPFDGSLDFTYYKKIHRHLFDDLYDWAGTVRTVNLSKQRTRFCDCKQVEELATLSFARIGKMNYLQGLERADFIVELANFYTNVNYLHPFREGNGRCQRLYFRELATRSGYLLNFAKVDEDKMMIATIHAASGVMDTLLQVFDEIIE